MSQCAGSTGAGEVGPEPLEPVPLSLALGWRRNSWSVVVISALGMLGLRRCCNCWPWCTRRFGFRVRHGVGPCVRQASPGVSLGGGPSMGYHGRGRVLRAAQAAF